MSRRRAYDVDSGKLVMMPMHSLVPELQKKFVQHWSSLGLHGASAGKQPTHDPL